MFQSVAYSGKWEKSPTRLLLFFFIFIKDFKQIQIQIANTNTAVKFWRWVFDQYFGIQEKNSYFCKNLFCRLLNSLQKRSLQKTSISVRFRDIYHKLSKVTDRSSWISYHGFEWISWCTEELRDRQIIITLLPIFHYQSVTNGYYEIFWYLILTNMEFLIIHNLSIE